MSLPRRLSRCRFWLALGLAAWWWLPGCPLMVAAPGDGPNVATHLVREGDTIPRLCWQYRVRAEAIRAANPGVDDPLPVGRKLTIPLESAPAGPTPAETRQAHPAPAHATSREAFLATLHPTPSAHAATPGPAAESPGHHPAPPAATPPPDAAVRVAAILPPVRETRAPLPSPGETPPVVTTTRLPPPAANTPRPAERAVTVVSSVGLVSAPPPPAGSRRTASAHDFEDAARWLMARNIRYNEDWTPPGEREPWTMDCSNTTRWLYHAVAGVDLPRTASDQYESLRRRGHAWEVPPGSEGLPDADYLIDHLRMGDLLFWENTYEPVRHPNITHVMILLGEDDDHYWKMVGSQTRDGVSIYEFDPNEPKGGYTSLSGNVYHPGRFVAYGRP